MTTATASRKRPTPQQLDRDGQIRSELKTRMLKIKSRKIDFIPNAYFPEMDAANRWRTALAVAENEQSAAVDHAPCRSGMPAHLEQMCASPLLTAEEERNLFCEMNYLKYRAHALRSSLHDNRLHESELSHIEQLLTRAEQLRNRIVSSNTRLVVSIVKQFADEKNPFDELLSEGISCLLKVVEKFDFDRGFRFSTYATLAVRREVFRLIKCSHRNRSRFATGADEVLDQQVLAPAPTERTEANLAKINTFMSQLITRLDEREQFIVKARFGFVDLGMKPSFSKLGEKLGVSKERVRQLEARAMGKLRGLVEEVSLADAWRPA